MHTACAWAFVVFNLHYEVVPASYQTVLKVSTSQQQCSSVDGQFSDDRVTRCVIRTGPAQESSVLTYDGEVAVEDGPHKVICSANLNLEGPNVFERRDAFRQRQTVN